VLKEADFSRTQFAKANGSKRCTKCVSSAEKRGRKRKHKRTGKSPSSKAHGQARARNKPRWCENCLGWYQVLCGGCDVAASEEDLARVGVLVKLEERAKIVVIVICTGAGRTRQ